MPRTSNRRVASVRPSRSAQVGRVHGNLGRAARTAGRVLGAPVRVGVGRCAPQGRWVTRCEQVLVPGYWDEQFVPATYGWVYDSCGRRSWGIVRAAYCDRVWIPARYETQTRRVWVQF